MNNFFLLPEPPPAHSYARKYSIPQQPLPLHDLHHGTSPPIAAPAPLSNSPGIHIPSPTLNSIDANIQSKPLDLGISDRHHYHRNDSPPIVTKIHATQKPATETTVVQTGQLTAESNVKISRTTIEATLRYNLENSIQNHANNSIKGNDEEMNESREITITNGTENSTNEINKHITQTIFKTTDNPLRTCSADGLLRTNLSSSPSPSSAQSAPATPVKFLIDYEKASSPGML